VPPTLGTPKVQERRGQTLERERLLLREAELTTRVRELEEEISLLGEEKRVE
jgi:hypothetical protein